MQNVRTFLLSVAVIGSCFTGVYSMNGLTRQVSQELFTGNFAKGRPYTPTVYKLSYFDVHKKERGSVLVRMASDVDSKLKYVYVDGFFVPQEGFIDQIAADVLKFSKGHNAGGVLRIKDDRTGAKTLVYALEKCGAQRVYESVNRHSSFRIPK